MKVILDTHTFIWMDDEPSKLSATAVTALANPAADVMVSVVSVWEIIIKVQLGKWLLSAPLIDIIKRQQANGVQILGVTLDHVMMIANLPSVHRDPFDRLLAAQSIVESADLVTKDPIFAQYPVRVIW